MVWRWCTPNFVIHTWRTSDLVCFPVLFIKLKCWEISGAEVGRRSPNWLRRKFVWQKLIGMSGLAFKESEKTCFCSNPYGSRDMSENLNVFVIAPPYRQKYVIINKHIKYVIINNFSCTSHFTNLESMVRLMVFTFRISREKKINQNKYSGIPAALLAVIARYFSFSWLVPLQQRQYLQLAVLLSTDTVSKCKCECIVSFGREVFFWSF